MTKKQFKPKYNNKLTQFSNKKSQESPKPTDKFLGKYLNLEIIIILLYLLTEFVPQFDAIDVMGSQWLYLSILNCFTTLYLLIRKRFVPNQFFKSTLFILYSSFILIAGLSFFVSYNIIESIVTYTRLLVSFIALINILSIINYNPKIIKHVFLLMGLIVLCQSLDVIIEFIIKIPKYPKLDDLILSLTGNTGNKNILAASIVIKIPFVLYAIYNVKKYGRIFYLTILFLSFLSIFIINARASFVSLFLEIFIFILLVIIYYFKNSRKLAVLIKPALVLSVLILTIFIFQISFTALQKQKIKGEYGGLEKRISEISISNPTKARVSHWKISLDLIKKHPLLGVGLGNWKIISIPYDKYNDHALTIRKHGHNDFLEMTADIGILGGIVYIGIFICSIFYALYLLYLKRIIFEYKIIIITVLMSLIAYCIDAFFNFPVERANIQILLTIIIAIFLFCYNLRRKKKVYDSFYDGKAIVLIVFSVFTIYINYNVFKSMEVQNLAAHDFHDLNNKDILYKSEKINPLFPWIPNISETGVPIACIKAKYLFQEQKYQEAFDVLNNDSRSNPNIYFSEYLRGRIYEKINQSDSAMYYAKFAFYNRPATDFYYKFLNILGVEYKDSIEIEKSFIKYKNKVNNSSTWSYYADQLYLCTYNLKKKITILNEGLKEFPNDSTLLYNYNYFNGVFFFRQKDYEKSIIYFNESLKLKNNDSILVINIGMAYYNLGYYKNAIPYYSDLINKNAFNDGKPDFYRGICYKKLGLKDSACFDFKNAKAYGYNVEPELMDGCK